MLAISFEFEADAPEGIFGEKIWKRYSSSSRIQITVPYLIVIYC